MRSFYRPTPERHRIVIEADVFPSDRYAVMGVARAHGLDPDDAVVVLTPRPGERHLRTEDVTDFFERRGHVGRRRRPQRGRLPDRRAARHPDHHRRRAPGRRLDRLGPGPRGRERPRPAPRLGRRLRRLVPLQVRQLRTWRGRRLLRPRAPRDRPGPGRPGGWWGHDPGPGSPCPSPSPPSPAPRAGRSRTHPSSPWLRSGSRWRCSRTSGWSALRARSVRLTAFLERLLDAVATRRPVEVITPRDPDRRGAQLSVMVDDAAAVTEALFERAPGAGRRPAAQHHPLRPGPALQHLPRLLAGRRSRWTTVLA